MMFRVRKSIMTSRFCDFSPAPGALTREFVLLQTLNVRFVQPAAKMVNQAQKRNFEQRQRQLTDCLPDDIQNGIGPQAGFGAAGDGRHGRGDGRARVVAVWSGGG